MNKSIMGYKLILTLLVVSLISGIAYAEIPPTPVNLEANVSGTWVNYTWDAGTGNVTDLYYVGVSVSGAAISWTNDSATNSSNNNVGIDEWAEIWVYAYNSTEDGNLSVGYAYADTYADRSKFGTTVDLMNSIPTILSPIPSIIVVVITIMVTLAIGALIVGILGSIISGLKRKIDM